MLATFGVSHITTFLKSLNISRPILSLFSSVEIFSFLHFAWNSLRFDPYCLLNFSAYRLYLSTDCNVVVIVVAVVVMVVEMVVVVKIVVGFEVVVGLEVVVTRLVVGKCGTVAAAKVSKIIGGILRLTEK